MKSLIRIMFTIGSLLATTNANADIDDIIIDKKELKCLVDNVFYEARGESVRGMIAVIDVTLNRVDSRSYPNTVCGVVYQRKQFSWTDQPKQKVSKEELVVIYKNAELIAKHRLIRHNLGLRKGIVFGALWYHNNTVNPSWAKKLKVVKRYKNHIFYAAN